MKPANRREALMAALRGESEMEMVRPSALPKLLECRCYEGKPGTSAAAERGTRIDAAIRRLYALRQGLPWNDADGAESALNDEDAEAVRWALDKLDELSLDPLTDEHHAVETRESELRAVVPVEGVLPGTMDALCVGLGWLVDFKTGQKRNYTPQMAAYALACMDAYFADRWTAHILFVDSQEVVSREFTEVEARLLVEPIVNMPPVPTACEYCKWCAKFEGCPEVMRQVRQVREMKPMPACSAAAKSKGELPEELAGMLSDHAKAHEFLSALAVANDWADVLKSKIKDQLTPTDGEAKVDSPYFTRVAVSGRRVVMPLQLSRYGMEFGFDRMLRLFSAAPESKVKEAWTEVFGDKPMPEEMVTTQGGSVQLRLKKLKK